MNARHKLQVLVYGILPSTTALFSYAIGSRKLSANEQFFVGAQTVVSLLQTTQVVSNVCFITDYVAYASSNKTKIVESRRNSFSFLFLPEVDASHVYVRAWALGCFLILKPFLNSANVCSPNILRTLRRTMIRFLIELLVRRIWFGQSKLYFILNWLVTRCKLRPELAADAQQTA